MTDLSDKDWASMHRALDGLRAGCDYCKESDPDEDGWHVVRDPEGIEGDQRIPCANRDQALPFGAPAPEAAISTAKPRRHRHVYDVYSPGVGDADFNAIEVSCVCGAIQDPDASRRGRNARKRGINIQRKLVVGLGGLNLAGNNENLDGIGSMFAYEAKSGGSFPELPYRWLKGIPATGGRVGVLIMSDAPGPGHKARRIVIVDYDDWRDLHGD